VIQAGYIAGLELCFVSANDSGGAVSRYSGFKGRTLARQFTICVAIREPVAEIPLQTLVTYRASREIAVDWFYTNAAFPAMTA